MTANDLYYNSPALNWLDGLPLGNGRLGAMVLAGPDQVRLQINDSTAWSGSPASEHRCGRVTPETAAAALARARAAIADGRPVDAEHDLEALQSRYSQAYLPFANVLVQTPASAHLVERGLSLQSAASSSLQQASGTIIQQDTFISAPDQVLVHRLHSGSPVDVVLRLQTPLRLVHCTSGSTEMAVQLQLPADAAPGHEPDEPPLTWELPGITPVAGAAVLALSHNGQPGAAGNDGEGASVALAGITELVFVLATSTSFTVPGQPRAAMPRNAPPRPPSGPRPPWNVVLTHCARNMRTPTGLCMTG